MASGRKLILEKTSTFQGLPEFVALDEGLFAAEGVGVAFVERERNALRASQTDVTDPSGLDPSSSHGATVGRLVSAEIRPAAHGSAVERLPAGGHVQ